jgi:hypothetical protein
VSPGFFISPADPCLYIKNCDDRLLMLVLHVDDGLIAATDEADMNSFLCSLKNEFKVTVTDALY